MSEETGERRAQLQEDERRGAGCPRERGWHGVLHRGTCILQLVWIGSSWGHMDTVSVHGLLPWVTPELVAKSSHSSLSVSSSLPAAPCTLPKLSTSQESKRQLISSAMTGKEGLSSARLSKAELEALLTHDV